MKAKIVPLKTRRVFFNTEKYLQVKLLMPQYHSILSKPNAHLRGLNRIHSESFECFNIKFPSVYKKF